MQLRSGKTTQTMCSDMRFYGKIHCGNITMTMEHYTPHGVSSGKKTKPIIAKHSMTLRTRKPTAQVEQEPHHFADMVSMPFADRETIPLAFKDWLISRLKGLVVTFNQISIEDYNELIMERSRIFMEMTAVLREHIDYITTSPSFVKFSHVLYSKLLSFKKELTMLLNGEKLSGSRNKCNFSPDERAFLGNVRSDIVSLLVITKHRLPKLHVV